MQCLGGVGRYVEIHHESCGSILVEMHSNVEMHLTSGHFLPSGHIHKMLEFFVELEDNRKMLPSKRIHTLLHFSSLQGLWCMFH